MRHDSIMVTDGQECLLDSIRITCGKKAFEEIGRCAPLKGGAPGVFRTFQKSIRGCNFGLAFSLTM
jgi:hypothetical protein